MLLHCVPSLHSCTVVLYLVWLTFHQQMKLCTEISPPSLILSSTRVVTIVHSVVKWTYCQLVVTELVATRGSECIFSFLPCHLLYVIFRSSIINMTCQCNGFPFSWIPGSCVSHFCSWGVWNRNTILLDRSNTELFKYIYIYIYIYI